MTRSFYAFAVTENEYRGIVPDDMPGGEPAVITTPVGSVLAASINQQVVDRLRLAENPLHLHQVADWILLHERMVQLAAQAGACYPFGFATVFTTQDALKASLASQADTIRQHFDHVRGAEEWAIKVCVHKQAEKRSQDARQASSGLDYLRRRSANAAPSSEDIARRATTLTAPLRDLARDWRDLKLGLAPAPDLEVIGNYAALVDQGLASEFTAAGARQQALADQATQITVSGPWPPFSFRPKVPPDVPEA